MTKIIRLTVRSNGRPIFVNFDNVAYFKPISAEPGGTQITFIGSEGNYLASKTVAESTDQIVDLFGAFQL